jgi:hypothetical protein
MIRSPRDIEEARARKGHFIITAIRFNGIALIMLGFAIATQAIDLPWIIGACLAVAGFFEFFFLPRFIARRFRAGDSREP